MCYFEKSKWGVWRNGAFPIHCEPLHSCNSGFCCSQHLKSPHKLRPPCSFSVICVSRRTTQANITQSNYVNGAGELLLAQSPAGVWCCSRTCQPSSRGCGTMVMLCCTCYSALSVARPLLATKKCLTGSVENSKNSPYFLPVDRGQQLVSGKW